VHKFGIMVERQVQVRVLPGVAGSRANLEPQLWELLVFCLDGHEAEIPGLDDASFERALVAVQSGKTLSGEAQAAYPRAATAVMKAIETLREVGVYPPPKIR
jgi:hypothetical protein